MEKKRKTPEYITALQPNEIFVFGSNLKGIHGGVETVHMMENIIQPLGW